MEQIKEIIKFEELKTKIDQKIRPLVKQKADEMFKEMPADLKRLGNIWLRMLMWLSFIFIIPIFIYKSKVKKYNDYVMEKLDLSNIYSMAMDQIEEFDFQNLVETTDVSDLYSLRINRIPGDAQITKYTDIIKFKLLKKYNAQIRTGLGLWIRSNGKNTQVYTCPTGYIQIQTPDLLPKFQYTLFHSSKLLSKGDQMEDRIFNKEFNFTSNDPIQSRVMYTPLTMEKTIEHKKNIGLSWWVVEKKSNVINIRFRPRKWNQAELDIKLRNNTAEKFANHAINDIADDMYLIYKLLELVLIPILL